MSYQAKIDWKYDDTVTEGDLNRIEQGVKEAHEKSTENEQDLTTHLADNMYQIPTIVGTQIRINRLSNTDRLFFKLDADLTGNITISTDSGATDKPLVDIDENQITQLEKGFVEVVADASFFILRNRGISSADKQALIDIINEAERNESDLKSQFIDAVNEVDTEGGIDLPADAPWAEVLANVPSIKTGKKWAIGLFTPTGTSGIRSLTKNGLPFKSKIVIIQNLSSPAYFALYNSLVSETNVIYNSNGTITSTSTNVTITDDGFTVRYYYSAPSREHMWIAIE